MISCHVLIWELKSENSKLCFFWCKKNHALGCFFFLLYNNYFEIGVILKTKVPVTCYMCKDLLKMTVVQYLYFEFIEYKTDQ